MSDRAMRNKLPNVGKEVIELQKLKGDEVRVQDVKSGTWSLKGFIREQRVSVDSTNKSY